MNETILQNIYYALPSIVGVFLFILMDMIKYFSLKKATSIEEYHNIEMELLPGLALWISGLALIIFGLTLPVHPIKTISLLIMVAIQITEAFIIRKKKQKLRNTFVGNELYGAILLNIKKDIEDETKDETSTKKSKTLFDQLSKIKPQHIQQVICLALEYDSKHERILEKEQNNEDQAHTIIKILSKYLETEEASGILKGKIPKTKAKLDIEFQTPTQL